MKLKPGQIVSITFLDHCLHDGDELIGPLEFTAYGKLIKMTSTYYTISSWMATNNSIDSNTELCTIVKKAVSKIKILK